MPLLDVSDVLSDPDFCEAVTLTRSASTISDLGRTVTTPTDQTIVAVVQPATSNDLLRMPDGARLGGAVTVYTTTPLIPLADGVQADIITWGGSTYTVRTVDDWSHFGRGYVRALAELRDLR